MGSRLACFKLKGLGLALLTVSIAPSVRAQTYTAIDLGMQPNGGSTAGINNGGQIVSSNATNGGGGHAFLYTGGTTIDLGILPGGSYSYGYGINNSGQVVGSANYASLNTHAFLYSGGTMIDLGTLPGGFQSAAYGINNSGQVAGASYTAAGGEDAFLYSGGAMIDLGTLPGGFVSFGFGINDSGQVVGSGDYAGGPYFPYETTHAFLYSSGTMTDLGTLPGASPSISGASGVNNSGQVVGDSYTATGVAHAFLYSGEAMIDLGTLPGGSYSSANGINNGGQVVGRSDVAGPFHAFLYSGGTMVDLNSLVSLAGGYYLENATGINDFGQIAANGSNGHAYLLTPGNSPLTVLNPFAPYATHPQAPPTLDVPTVLNSPSATSLAADGESAVVLAYRSQSPEPVTFAFVSVSGISLSTSAPVGALGPFDPNYLASPNPPSGMQSYSDLAPYQATPTGGPDADGNYTFLALLWATNAMPAPGVSPLVTLTVSAQQGQGLPVAQASIALEPPPLLLVHGVWSSADGAWPLPPASGFPEWLEPQYPHNLIFRVNYGICLGPTLLGICLGTRLSSQDFGDPMIQNILLST